jgi:hypothetical protein
MTKTSKVLLALFGLFFVLIVPQFSRAQSPGDADPKTSSTQSESQSTSPADQAGPVAGTHTQTPTPKPSPHPTKIPGAKSPAPAVQNLSLPTIEETMLQNLDTAIQLARKMGVPPPTNWLNADLNKDSFSKKRDDLQGAFARASNQLSQAEALSQTTDALSELLAALQAHTAAAAPSPSQAPENNNGSISGRGAGLLVRLPLYLASAALIVSMLALWRGWLLARREVNKALAEVGLL